MTPNSAHGGSGWEPRSSEPAREIGRLWRSFGQNSEYGRLRAVLLVPPGIAIRECTDPRAALWDAPVCYERARDEFAAVVDLYASLGVDVLMPEPGHINTFNGHYVRDTFTMTGAGAVVSRLASSARAGEEAGIASALIARRVPIFATVSAPGIFEGPDLVFFAPDRAFVGIGLRSDITGAQQVGAALKGIGVECTIVETTFGCGHLDGVLSILDRDLAVLRPRMVSFKVYETLVSQGYTIVTFDDEAEAEAHMAINMVAVDRRCAIMPAGATRCANQLRQHGVEITEISMPELMKGGGAIHCMTGVIEREKV